MKVYLTPEFIGDLRDSADVRFIRQVLKHTLDGDGNFKSDANDHKYQGIDKAWIRVISKGKAGFRVIYLKENDSVYLYRAGLHSIEEQVTSPLTLDASIPLSKVRLPVLPQEKKIGPVDLGYLLKTTEPTFLNKEILSMYHLGYFEIILISPFIDPGLLHRRHHFGSFLDRAVEDNTEVTVVTRPPNRQYLSVYRDLEERNIFVYFLLELHAKLYIFNLDPAKLPEHSKTIQSRVIVGSSNLTRPGFGLDDDITNYELCYCLPTQKYSEAYEYAKGLIKKAADYRSIELK